MLDHPIPAIKVTLYLPDRDQNGQRVDDVDGWASEASRLLAKLAGGATRMPAKGVWFNEKLGTFIEETTYLIYAYVSPNDMVEHRRALQAFIGRFLVAANQQTVAVEMGDKMYFVGYAPQRTSRNGQALVSGATHA